VGLGQLIVLIPEDMTLELDSEVQAGEIAFPGRDRVSGTDLELRATAEPVAQGSSSFTVELDAVIGAGNLEVRREAA